MQKDSTNMWRTERKARAGMANNAAELQSYTGRKQTTGPQGGRKGRTANESHYHNPPRPNQRASSRLSVMITKSKRPRQFPQRLARPISRLLLASMKRPQSFHIYTVILALNLVRAGRIMNEQVDDQCINMEDNESFPPFTH
ncbi:hypothetical protein TNCV_3720041 [Trichonephila clavipes]|nr:hypothetical protein TNCV_3720041 [Trichonephila clavipes]